MLTVCEHVNQVTASTRPEEDVSFRQLCFRHPTEFTKKTMLTMCGHVNQILLSKTGSIRHFRHNRGCDISLSSEDGQDQKRFAMSLCQSGDCSPRRNFRQFYQRHPTEYTTEDNIKMWGACQLSDRSPQTGRIRHFRCFGMRHLNDYATEGETMNVCGRVI